MKISVEGKVFVLTGALQTMKRHEAERGLARLGALVVKTPTKKTDYVVVGARPGGKLVKARNYGIPELTEEELVALLAGEEVEHEAAEVEEVPLRDAIGELRSLFDGAITEETWKQVCALLDATPDAEAQVIVHYARSALERWSDRGRFSELTINNGADWQPIPAKRLATSDWTHALLRGEQAERFSLVEAIDLTGYKANGTQASRLTENPSLSGLRALSLGSRNNLSMTFFKKLLASEHLGQLEHLSLFKLKPAWSRVFVTETHNLTGLRTVSLLRNDAYLREEEFRQVSDDLAQAPFWPQIEHLVISGSGWGERSVLRSILTRHDQFGALRRLSVMQQDVVGLLLRHELMDQLDALDLGGYVPDFSGLIAALEAHPPQSIRQLRIAPNLWSVDPAHVGPWTRFAALVESMPSLERLLIAKHLLSPELYAQLTALEGVECVLFEMA